MLNNLLEIHLKLLQNCIAIQITAEATVDLIGNKIADRSLKTSSQNDSQPNEEEILRKRYISPKQRQKLIDDIRLL